MAEIQLHNTLSGKLEPFVPQKPGEVRMYTCGPTVYDYAHIGNYRTFVFQDILRRFLKLRGFQLQHVMNLTDVDDRIIANAAAAGKNIRDYTEKFAQAFSCGGGVGDNADVNDRIIANAAAAGQNIREFFCVVADAFSCGGGVGDNVVVQCLESHDG